MNFPVHEQQKIATTGIQQWLNAYPPRYQQHQAEIQLITPKFHHLMLPVICCEFPRGCLSIVVRLDNGTSASAPSRFVTR